MSIFACLNSLYGRKGGFGKDELVKGNSPEVVSGVYQIPRKYKVPVGLKDRVLELQDKTEIAGSRHRAHEALWFLLNERCPETRDGQWKVAGNGADVFVVEVLA